MPTGADGGLAVPTGRTVQLYLTSPDVIHAFYVPQFLFKRDVVPGRVNQFDFKVDDVQAGQTFRGQCAELCGSGHRIMLFDVHALAGPDFDAWLAGKIAGAPPAAAGPGLGQPSAPAESGAPPSGEPVAGTTLTVVAKNAVAFDDADADGAGQQPHHDRVRQPGRAAPQRQDLQGRDRRPGRLRRRDLHRVRPRSRTRSARSRPARTPSTAPSTPT